MSLIRVRRIEDTVELPNINEVINEFKCTVEEYIKDTNKNNLAELVKDYSNISYLYLKEISRTLYPNDRVKDTMVFMNSVIAEACHEVGISYFHKTQGYSLIDKSVAYVIDNGFQYDAVYVFDIIEEMERVIKEEEEQEKLIDEAWEA